MNRILKRSAALLLTLVLLLGVLSGLTASAVSANNGTRGKLCTSLSAAAKSYYGSGYDYETLSKLSGTTLEAKLRTLMANGYKSNTYDQLKTYFKYTDAIGGSTSSMNCFYSNTKITGTMNREHVWPRSLGNFQYEAGTAGADVLHLKPTDATANSLRSNLPFGEVTGGAYQTAHTSYGAVSGYYSAAYFEPLDAVKGDVARTILYVYTRWEQRNIDKVFQSTDLLLKWCELDPVDEFEMQRNDICQQYVNSRNVYVDYPEYCWRVFGKAIPTHMKTPSGKGNTCNSPDYTVTVTTAPTCTANGVETHTCKNCGYSYTEVLPAAGHHYVNGVCTVCGKAQAATQYFFTANIANGDRVVILSAPNKKLATTTASPYTNSNGETFQQLASATATIAGQELSFTDKAAAVFTVVKSGSSYAFKLDDGRYLTCPTAQNLTLTATPAAGTNYWTLEASANNTWYVKNTTTYYETYQKNYQYLEFYANKFTTYGMQGGGAAFEMTFYKETSNVCDHDYQVTATRAATCTEGGFTSYQCTKCGDAYTVYTDPLGHDYVTTTFPATTEAGGYDEHVCSRCGDTYRDNYTDALGDPCEKFTDVDRTAWYHGAVDYAIENKLMNGTSDTTFDPTGTMTRTMLVQVLYNLEGTPDVSSIGAFAPTFTDVKGNEWFAKAVTWASYYGIVSGYDSGAFGVNDPVTREQIASILYRYAGHKKADLTGAADLSVFPDEGTVSDWAKPSVAWAVNAGFISGKGQEGGPTLLAPKGEGTRAEVASMLMRFVENVLK